MRGFLAFGIAADLTAELKQAVSAVPGGELALLHPPDYHLTIKFLSEFSSTRFFSCLEELSALGAPPANAFLAGRLVLWPMVLALECEPSEEMRRWHGSVNTLLESKGFLRERHPSFRPHITLARRRPERKYPEAERHLLGAGGLFAGRAITLEPPALWRSQAEGTGRRHEAILSVLF